MTDGSISVLAVADSDSYLKWAAATLRRLPGSWSTELVLLRSELLPSVAQRRAAVGERAVPVVGLGGLIAAVRRSDPDVIILGCTGPVVELLSALPMITNRVLVSGLPGIAYPASDKALRARRRCDVLVLHSRRERTAFAGLARDHGVPIELALARLPYLGSDRAVAADDHRDAVIFAAQALVPPRVEQRRQILTALSGLPPQLRPVVKLRARGPETQTHHEDHPYPELDPDPRIGFSHAAMEAELARAYGFVTVSSSAALEAMAAGVGVIVLDDFGVTPQMINTVFTGSGCLGSLADLRAGRFHRPDPGWLADNYFHPDAEDDLVAIIRTRLHRPVGRRPRPSWPRLAGAAARLLAPVPIRRALRRVWATFRGRSGPR